MLQRCRSTVAFSVAIAFWFSVLPARAVDDDQTSPPVEPARRPACIVIWLEGGPPTVDMWDLKQGPRADSSFKPIATAGNMQICEHFPKIAKLMDKLSIVRSMTTRGEVGERARSYMRTCYVPHPFVEHPEVGSVLARELSVGQSESKFPVYLSPVVRRVSAGYLEHPYTPLVLEDAAGFLGHTTLARSNNVLARPISLVDEIDNAFDIDRGGQVAEDYRGSKRQTLELLKSSQLDALSLEGEDPELFAQYGNNDFGRRLIVARRLIERGVPFVEVTLKGWDQRSDYFAMLLEDLFPKLDAGLSTLVRDLENRELFDDTVVVVSGAFGRSPRVRHATRDHFGRSWSLLIGGGGIQGGKVIGKTTLRGRFVESDPTTPGDLWATVGKSLGISLNTVYTTRTGRPVRIFNSGRPIPSLLVR